MSIPTSSLVDQALTELSPSARTLYTEHLATDAQTHATLALLERVARVGGLEATRSMRIATQAALLHRLPALLRGDEGDEATPRDLEALPFAVDVELERVLLGHGSHEAMVRHCAGRDERTACALLALARAWSQRRQAPAWVWEPLAEHGVAESDLAELMTRLEP